MQDVRKAGLRACDKLEAEVNADNPPPQDFPQDPYQHQPPHDDYPPPPQQYASHDVPKYQQPEFNSPLGSLPPSSHRHDAGAAQFPEHHPPEFNSLSGSPHRSPAHHDARSRYTNSPPVRAEEVNEHVYPSERTETHGQPSMRWSPVRGQESFGTGERIPSMRWSPERGLESFRRRFRMCRKR